MKLLRATPSILLLAGTVLASATRAETALAAGWTVPSIYSNWNYAASPAGYPSMTSTLIIQRDPGPSVQRFWASQFYTNGPGGNGGYIGIQDGAPRNDGSVGKVVIFSFWGASSASPGGGAKCSTFGGEGTGYHCLLDYPWAEGKRYELAVKSVGGGAWQGSIVDPLAGTTSVIGTIQVPAGWGGLTNWVHDFTEDFGENSGASYPSCSSVPPADAVFFAPIVAGAGPVQSAADQINSGSTCANVTTVTSADRAYAIQTLDSGNPPAPRPLPTTCGQMTGGTGLVVGTGMASCDGVYQLHMQADGALVLFHGATQIWSSGTHTGLIAVMQGDGNFVIDDDAGGTPWATRTQGHGGSRLALQNDGNLVLYAANGAVLWATNTSGR